MTEDARTFVLSGGSLEPMPVPTHVRVPNETADKAYSPPPDWVVELLDAVHKCAPFPNGGRHHIGVWERLVRRLPLTPQAKGVAAVLTEHWPKIHPSLSRISDLSGMSRSSCDNGIYMLRLAGLLELKSTTGQNTTYVPCYPARAITTGEVDFAKQWRRNARNRPAQPVGTSGETTCPTGGHPPAQPATPPAHPLSETRPTGGREVINEGSKEDSEPSPGRFDDSDSLMATFRLQRTGTTDA